MIKIELKDGEYTCVVEGSIVGVAEEVGRLEDNGVITHEQAQRMLKRYAKNLAEELKSEGMTRGRFEELVDIGKLLKGGRR